MEFPLRLSSFQRGVAATSPSVTGNITSVADDGSGNNLCQCDTIVGLTVGAQVHIAWSGGHPNYGDGDYYIVTIVGSGQNKFTFANESGGEPVGFNGDGAGTWTKL